MGGSGRGLMRMTSCAGGGETGGGGGVEKLGEREGVLCMCACKLFHLAFSYLHCSVSLFCLKEPSRVQRTHGSLWVLPTVFFR